MPIRPPSGPTAPRSDYTTMIRDGGLEAVTQARQARRWGTAPMVETGAPYALPAAQPNDVYDQWLAQLRPQEYPIIHGRTPEGAYAGFKTQGELQSAIGGRADAMRDESMARFAALDQLASEGLDRAQTDYRARDREANLRDWTGEGQPTATRYTDRSGWTRPIGAPPMGSVDPIPAGTDPTNPAEFDVQGNVIPPSGKPPSSRMANPGVAAKTYGDYARKSYVANELEPWLAETAAPLLERQDFAQQGLRTPFSAFGEAAGAEYGVDPNIVQGWYDDQADLADYGVQRNLDSIAATGMPYEDYQQALDALEADQRRADTEAEAGAVDAEKQAIEDFVYESTGGIADATSLAQATDTSPIDVAGIVASPAYQQYAAEISDALNAASETGDFGTVDSTVSGILDETWLTDPALFKMLSAVYGDYIPEDYVVGG